MAVRVVYYLALLVGICVVVWFFVWSSIFHPSKRLAATPADVGLAFEEVFFMAEDGKRLHGWWVPVPDAKGAVIICHGNAGNIGDRVTLLSDLVALGCNLFLFDYRGYGKSSGWAGEKGSYKDVRAAFEAVRARYDDADHPPVIVYGRSLGGAIALQAALDKPVRAAILESTFTSVKEMARHLYGGIPIDVLSPYRFDSLSKMDRLKVPVLVAHSRDDEIIPFRMGRELYEKAPEPKQFRELRGSHNEFPWYTDPGYMDMLRRFVDNATHP